MTHWTEKYRPQSLEEVLGNPTAVSELRRWAQAWTRGIPDRRAVILQGEPGIGKTSAALALGREMGWTVIEMNASDQRNAEAIRRTAARGAVLETFSSTGEFLRTGEGGRKLIVLDEADNVFGREDQGGIAAIVQMIRETRQPVILIVNDLYGLTSRSSAIKRLCKTIKFQPVHAAAMKKILKDVAAKEGVDVSEDVLEFIADRSLGDMRSALTDLQALAVGTTELRSEATSALGFRDRESTIFAALGEIFRSGDARRSRDAVRALDEDPETLALWVDHNLPFEYRSLDDLARGYDRLARADIFLGRRARRQDYGMWGYAYDLLSAGVATARKGRAAGGQLQFPMYLMLMSRSRGRRTARNSLAQKLGRHLHTSAALVRNDVLPDLRALCAADAEFRVHLTAVLGLDEKEAAYLLDEKEDSHAVKHLLESAAKVPGFGSREALGEGLQEFDEGDDPGA
ncbi:MAG: hypothetical protein A3K59_03625 [Euryarchaeota archaeon RBG_19FT_COMBO_69_17]|nr:MAG: hypothetical protein A3K59_03625 [Euryarchaeota archaeon RBG_19FT_COMBO_69_17]